MEKLNEIGFLLPYASLKTSAKTKPNPKPTLLLQTLCKKKKKKKNQNKNKTKYLKSSICAFCLCPLIKQDK